MILDKKLNFLKFWEFFFPVVVGKEFGEACERGDKLLVVGAQVEVVGRGERRGLLSGLPLERCHAQLLLLRQKRFERCCALSA